MFSQRSHGGEITESAGGKVGIDRHFTAPMGPGTSKSAPHALPLDAQIVQGELK